MPTAFVAENKQRDSESLRRLLNAKSMDVFTFSSLEDAERELIQASRKYDIAFLTWELSPLLLTSCRRKWPDLPTLVVSGSLDAWGAGAAIKLGAKGFLQKPVDASELKGYVRHLLADQDHLSEALVRIRRATFGKLGKRLVGNSPEFTLMLKKLAAILADSDSSVLITGESGTGKELVAQAIHQLGLRSGRAMKAVNVAEVTPNLLESELFGHVLGAFTDAESERRGIFAEAEDGTLFLDEIGELHLDLQAKLLRVIQEKVFRRVGGNQQLNLRARLNFATNRNLAEEVNSGRFRADLLHRISERQIHVPSLRDRTGDLPHLVAYFSCVHGNRRKIARALQNPFCILICFLGIFAIWRKLLGQLRDPSVEMIHPENLDLETMGTLARVPITNIGRNEPEVSDPVASRGNSLTVSPALLRMPLKEAHKEIERSFDSIYLRRAMSRAGYKWVRAARESGLDVKTFRSRCDACCVGPIDEPQSDGVDG